MGCPDAAILFSRAALGLLRVSITRFSAGEEANRFCSCKGFSGNCALNAVDRLSHVIKYMPDLAWSAYLQRRFLDLGFEAWMHAVTRGDVTEASRVSASMSLFDADLIEDKRSISLVVAGDRTEEISEVATSARTAEAFLFRCSTASRFFMVSLNSISLKFSTSRLFSQIRSAIQALVTKLSNHNRQ
jgi:hypothetical protein